jgi:hypothetical protein
LLKKGLKIFQQESLFFINQKDFSDGVRSKIRGNWEGKIGEAIDAEVVREDPIITDHKHESENILCVV